MKDFEGKVAVVTGASRGIGKAMAERFAEEGMRLVLVSRGGETLEGLGEELRARGAEVLTVPTDVSREEDVNALADKAFERFGAVHLLCLNAGVGADLTPLWRQTVESWEWLLGVNLWGLIFGVRAFVPRMIEQTEQSRVVITSSVSGLFPVPMNSAYHTAKFAVQGFAESLYLELEMFKAPVTVSLLCPGSVKTGFLEFESNRPEHIKQPPGWPDETERMWHGALERMLEAGMEPAKVVDSLMEGIAEDRFWVFPNTGPLAAVRTRVEDLVEQKNPRLLLTEAQKKELKIE